MKKFLLKIYYCLLEAKDKFIVFYNINITEKKKSPIVMDTDKTIDKIINDKCSVSRFGDGEFSLIYGENEFMISISYFKVFFINILRESPTRFILKNYIYIVNSFNELDDLNKFDIVIFFIKHIKTRFLLKYNY